ncbi:MAG TPA: hypothetical protein VGB24_24110 [Longimicrobium sp.]|jgi:hypothetical protein|uniref:hypothetical protein n=1 Tax=Longimicrobium sp. TaxID=2029185 RepID=UPI002EDAF30E
MDSSGGPEWATLRIPADLFGRVQSHAGEAGFASADEYVRFVLEEVTGGDEEPGEAGAAAGLTAEEEGDLVDRLRGLGYIE